MTFKRIIGFDLIHPASMNHLSKILVFLAIVICEGCATYYQKQTALQNCITTGNFVEAEKLLERDQKKARGINQVLYFFDRGVTNFMLGNYTASNIYFQQADHYIEDYSSHIGNEALALLTNPTIKPYKPEDFESVMIHYYMALNYLFLNNYEDALVECRRLNLQLQKINDKYRQNKNKYTEDAFALNLMGMIYEASGDYNNAFIAYRNSINAYEQVYLPLWNQPIPEQLKKDVIRSAFKTGFFDQVDFFEKKFNIKYVPDSETNGTVVFFWMNGFGPVKSEWSINFTNLGCNDGYLTLANDDYGLNFPIFIGNRSGSEQSALKDLSLLRIAFPKYLSREPFFTSASFSINDSLNCQLELAENINSIAHQCLKDRMVREISTSIARLAVKKAMESLARDQDKSLGSLVSIINAITEKADTRNWQSLPHSISYCRISLPKGKYNTTLYAFGKGTSQTQFEFNIEAGKTQFHTYHHLESSSPYLH